MTATNEPEGVVIHEDAQALFRYLDSLNFDPSDDEQVRDLVKRVDAARTNLKAAGQDMQDAADQLSARLRDHKAALAELQSLSDLMAKVIEVRS